MSSSASLPLQAAVISALKVDPAVAAVVADRVFDRVPTNSAKPYVAFGPSQILPEYADDYEGSSETFQLDGWSTAYGKEEIKRLGRAMRDALSHAELPLGDNQRTVLIEVEQERYLTEPDGLTQHAILLFVAHTEPTA
jgi:hypothetical protein